MWEKIEKIVRFVRTNYLYVIAALVFVVMGIYILNSRFKKDIRVVQSPFTSAYTGEISINGTVQEFESSVPILQTKSLSQSNVEAFIGQLDLTGIKKVVENSGVTRWQSSKGDDFVLFNTKSNLVTVSSASGLNLSTPKTSVINSDTAGDYFKSFVEGYLPELAPMRVSSIQDGVDVVTVNAVYSPKDVDDVAVGSMYNDGYAAKAVFTSLGQLKSLKILVLTELTKTRMIPAIRAYALQQYAGLKSYPREISYQIPEATYKKIPRSVAASLKLTSVSFSDSMRIWLYIDSKYNYVVPAYKFTGTGSVSDSQRKTYSADVIGYFLAVDPNYVFISETTTEDTKKSFEFDSVRGK